MAGFEGVLLACLFNLGQTCQISYEQRLIEASHHKDIASCSQDTHIGPAASDTTGAIWQSSALLVLAQVEQGSNTRPRSGLRVGTGQDTCSSHCYGIRVKTFVRDSVTAYFQRRGQSMDRQPCYSSSATPGSRYPRATGVGLTSKLAWLRRVPLR